MDATTQSDLVSQIRTGNATAWTAFITGHLSMVYDLAQDLAMSQDQHEELVDVGTVGLCESGRQFCDGSFDCRFTTYAYTRIRRAMVSYQRTEGGVSTEWMARISSKARKDMDKLRQRFTELGIDREPTVEDLAYVSVDGEPVDDDIRRYAIRLQGTPRFVPLSSEQMEQCAEIDHVFIDSLSPATRHIWCGLLQQLSLTDNVSLSVEAVRNDIPRDEVYDRVVMALKQWAADRAEPVYT